MPLLTAVITDVSDQQLRAIRGPRVAGSNASVGGSRGNLCSAAILKLLRHEDFAAGQRLVAATKSARPNQAQPVYCPYCTETSLSQGHFRSIPELTRHHRICGDQT